MKSKLQVLRCNNRISFAVVLHKCQVIKKAGLYHNALTVVGATARVKHFSLLKTNFSVAKLVKSFYPCHDKQPKVLITFATNQNDFCRRT
jgi:hypothetical protein